MFHITKSEKQKDIKDQMTSLEEKFVAMAILNNRLYNKDEPGNLLRSFPEKFSFLEIMTDTENI